MYIYDRLLIPSVDVTSNLQAESFYGYRVVSKYTLFNLAIAHHLQGRKTGDSVCLANARYLYKRIPRGSKSRNREALLNCLVLNGLADLAHRVGDYNACKLCMSLVAEIATKTKCLANTIIISSLELRAILLNHLLAQCLVAAQAARAKNTGAVKLQGPRVSCVTNSVDAQATRVCCCDR